MSETIDIQEQEILRFLDIPIKPFHDRSTRWLFEDKEYVRDLVDMLASELVARIDFSRLSPINSGFVSDTLREQVADMVFSVPFQTELGTDDLLIYILVEHQSSDDPIMGYRMLSYMMQIWDAQRKRWETDKVPKSRWRFQPILPIVYYTGEKPWKSTLAFDEIMDIPDMLARFVPKFDKLFLIEIENETASLKEVNHPLGWLLTVLQKQNADIDTLSNTLFEVGSYLESLDETKAPQRRKAFIYLVLLILNQRPDAEHKELLTLLDKHAHDMEVENMAKSILDRKYEQGEERGETRARREDIIRLLHIRFDNVPETVTQKVNRTRSLSRLNSLFEKAATIDSLDDFDE